VTETSPADNLPIHDAAAFRKGRGDQNRRQDCPVGGGAPRKRDDAAPRFHSNRIRSDSLIMVESFFDLRA
jgi:hypothetical protein